MMIKDNVHLKGIRVDSVTYTEIMDSLSYILKKKTPTNIITLNANMFYEAQRKPALKKIINSADIVTADGIGILWAARLFGYKIKERVTGFDLFKKFLNYANEHKNTVFLLGSHTTVLDRLILIIRRYYRNIRIIGSHHGYFDEKREAEIVQAVRKTRPDFLFCAMGSFKQEIFLYNYNEEMKAPVMIGVGGAFDVLAGRAILAPNWIRATGFEWLFRFISNPLRIKKVLQLPLFVLELLFYRIFKARVT
jgi:N-acetylglucosaminyldiphosphoundecaprenol N-acetyl-beta-D-mannosaminyltransferase